MALKWYENAKLSISLHLSICLVFFSSRSLSLYQNNVCHIHLLMLLAFKTGNKRERERERERDSWVYFWRCIYMRFASWWSKKLRFSSDAQNFIKKQKKLRRPSQQFLFVMTSFFFFLNISPGICQEKKWKGFQRVLPGIVHLQV